MGCDIMAKKTITLETPIEIEMKLDKIAELANIGMRQREIGERLGLSQQIVSYRMNLIKKNYPELLQTKQIFTKNSTNDLDVKNEVFVKNQGEEEIEYSKDFEF